MKHGEGSQKIIPHNADFWGLQRLPVRQEYRAIVINSTIFPRTLFENALFKDSSFLESLGSIGSIVPLITKVTNLAQNYDLIYANTQKALVVGALASVFSHRPLVYHLRDILSPDHFSRTNRRIAVTLANRFASLVIANSKATQAAFIAAGGRAEITEVVYNGFESDRYNTQEINSEPIKQQLGLDGRFVVGHFSRLSPWKGQLILLEALAQCPKDVTAIFVGDALFGEQDYVQQLHEQVAKLGIKERAARTDGKSRVLKPAQARSFSEDFVCIAVVSTAFSIVKLTPMSCHSPLATSATFSNQIGMNFMHNSFGRSFATAKRLRQPPAHVFASSPLVHPGSRGMWSGA